MDFRVIAMSKRIPLFFGCPVSIYDLSGVHIVLVGVLLFPFLMDFRGVMAMSTRSPPFLGHTVYLYFNNLISDGIGLIGIGLLNYLLATTDF